MGRTALLLPYIVLYWETAAASKHILESYSIRQQQHMATEGVVQGKNVYDDKTYERERERILMYQNQRASEMKNHIRESEPSLSWLASV